MRTLNAKRLLPHELLIESAAGLNAVRNRAQRQRIIRKPGNYSRFRAKQEYAMERSEFGDGTFSGEFDDHDCNKD